MVKVEMHDTIAVLELENGVTNAISPGLVADLAETLLEVQTSALSGLRICITVVGGI